MKTQKNGCKGANGDYAGNCCNRYISREWGGGEGFVRDVRHNPVAFIIKNYKAINKEKMLKRNMIMCACISRLRAMDYVRKLVHEITKKLRT